MSRNNGPLLDEDMAWLTPDCQKAIDFLNDPINDRMSVRVTGPAGCGYHDPTCDVATVEKYAREVGPDAMYSGVSENGRVEFPIGTNGEAEQPRRAGCITRCMADIEPCKVRWLWDGYVALGKVTIIVGDPGLGKSYASMDMAARASNGFGWPTEKLEPGVGYEQCPVVILNAEDDAHDTIRPRLDSLEANCCNIHVVEGVYRTAEADQPLHLSLAADLDLLEDTIVEKRARLVIIDPLSAYLGRVDSHKDAEVRSILSPLRSLAERRGVAVVAVMHLNKGTGTNAMQRAIGSVAFGAAARMMWLIAADPDNDHRRLFLPMKSNLKGQGTGLAFTITEDGKIAWDATPLGKGANQVLAELADHGRGTQGREAADFLREALAGGSMDSKELQSLAKEDGISAATLRRAKVKIGVESVKDGYGGGWRWELPTGKRD